MRDLKNKRQSNIKVFKNPDKSMTAAIYKEAVHYRKNGRWEDIDNTLSMEEVTAYTVARAAQETAWYVNGANAFEARFAAAAKDVIAQVDMEAYHADWTLKDCQMTEGVLMENHTGIIYPDIFSGVNLTYSLEGQKVKENLILSEKSANRPFRFIYRLNGLVPEYKDGEVILRDAQDNDVFNILRPMMHDSGSGVSDEVHTDFELTEDGFMLTLTADEQWLEDTDRVWPVYIDPSMTTSTAVADIHDTYIASGYAGSNFFQTHLLETGQTSKAGIMRSFMQFKLPELKSADMVVSARLLLTCYSQNNVSKQVNVHRVTSAWSDQTVTWNNRPSYDEKIADFAIFGDTTGKVVDFDITGIVKDWYTNGTNYGVMIKDSTEEGHYNEFLASTLWQLHMQVIAHRF